MADKTKYYNVEEFNKQKRQHGKSPIIPPRANFLAAANYIRDFFENKKFAYGVLGGLEMLCLGYRREMPDLHIAYNDRDFKRMKAKLEADKRFRLPDGMNPLFPSKILIRTGPAYEDAGCTDAAMIEVDLIPPGSHGTPSNGMLGNSLVIVSLKEPKLRTFKGLNMLYLVKTLVYYCSVRDLVWDPRKDIIFLCQHYGDDVEPIRDQLDQRAVQENFLGTRLFSRLSPEDQCRCYHVLLGKEPPPVMALTPPAPQQGHRYSRSAPAVPRLPNTPQYSSSGLSMNTSPRHLSPPLPGKPAYSRHHATKSEVQRIEVSAAHTASSELLVAARDSRSRYRPISAPNSRKSSPNAPHSTASLRSKSADGPDMPTQPTLPSPNIQSEGAQNMEITPLQGTSSLAPASTIAQARMSMPILNATFSGPVVPSASAQTFLAYGRGPHQSQQNMPHFPPLELYASQAPHNPGQPYLKSQVGLGGVSLLPNLRLTEDNLITNNPVHPNAMEVHGGPQMAGIEPSEAPKSQSQVGSLHVVSPDGDATHQQQYVPKPEEVTSKLHVIGPDGLYQTPPKPEPNSKERFASVPRLPSFAFELDAMSPQQSNIVAELSAHIDTVLQSNEKRAQFQEYQPEPMQPKPYNSTNEESLIRTSEPHTAASAGLNQQQELSRPPNSRTYSAPLSTLPASLTVGGLNHPHSRTPSGSVSYTSPQTAVSQVPAMKTNASRYSQYYISPASAPNSNGVSPQLSPAPLSVYKAYQPPVNPVLSSEIQPSITERTERQARSSSFGAVQDVDGAQSYFRSHKRDLSHDSQASSASHNSSQLAQEYQAEFPDFEDGYGSKDGV